MGQRTRLLAASTAFALATFAVAPAAQAAPKVTPESATEARAPVEGKAMSMDDREKAELFATEGRNLADPVLVLDGAAAFKITAEAERDIATAERAIAECRLALDMLHFLGDPRASTSWKPVAEETIGSEIERADGLIKDSEALIEEILAEQAAANAPPPEAPVEERKAMAPGTGMMIGGGVAMGLGVTGIAIGAVGIVKGRQAQDEVEDPTVTGTALEDADRRGKNANIMAYTGFAVGALGLGVGATLLALGAKKRKDAGGEEANPSAMILPTSNGLMITGRF